MDWTTLLFSFNGRINRGKYWLAALIYMIACVAYIAAIFMWIGSTSLDNLFSLAGTALLIWLLGIMLFIAGAWSGLAVGIKRLHDRDKSGWWILLFWLGPSAISTAAATMPDLSGGVIFHLAAAAVAIWAVVELGCLSGTPGPNQYGPDPLRTPAFAPRR